MQTERGEFLGEIFRTNRSWRGSEEHIIGLILVRGLYEYQTLIRIRDQEQGNYDHLVSQLLDSVEITEPQQLRQARDSREAAPTAWSTGLELARSLHNIGEPDLAMVSWNEILRLQPHSIEALSGWLETQQAYDLDNRDRAAEIAIERVPDEPILVVLAAEIFVDFNRREDAANILEAAWRSNDQDARVERAMNRWDIAIPDTHTNGSAP